MEKTKKNDAIDFKSEVIRKAIHFCSLSIPVIYYFITREQALTVLVPLTLLSIVLDLGRRFFPSLNNLLNSLFGFMLRAHEKDNSNYNLNGATWVFISATLVILIFPKIFVITGFAILIISDFSAALIGRKFGRHKFLFKSLEGTIAFFISASIVVMFTPKVEGLLLEYMIGIFAAAIGAIAENVSYGWADDNLLVPVSIGIAMWILYALFLPELTITAPF